MSSRGRPLRTPVRTYFAAVLQAAQGLFSVMQSAMVTGVSAQGARNSVTISLNSRRSRGVSGLVSIPGRRTSATSFLSVDDAPSPLEESWQAARTKALPRGTRTQSPRRVLFRFMRDEDT